MISIYGGWIANALMLAGSFMVGGRRKTGFALIFAGEVCWFATVVSRWPIQWDMVFICSVFGLMAGVNWLRWYWMERSEQDGSEQADEA